MVFAFNRSNNEPATGNASNITAKLRLDYGTATAIGDTNPTEIEDGYYEFDLTQAETNANVIDILPESATSGVQVIGVPGRSFTDDGTILTGPNVLTLTITDSVSSLPIQSAKIRIYRTGESGTNQTNASGVAVFALASATWSYAITASGYAGSTGSIVVSASASQTIQLALSSFSPASAPLCTVMIHLLDQYGADLPDEPVEITFVRFTDDATATPPVLSIPPVLTSDQNGVVSVSLYRNATYKAVYGTHPYARRIDFTVPDAGTYEVEQ